MPNDQTLQSRLRRLVPKPVRSAIRRARSRGTLAAAGEAPRRGPNDPGGIARLHVGCGPKNLMADWWNVDIRSFKGID